MRIQLLPYIARPTPVPTESEKTAAHILKLPGEEAAWRLQDLSLHDAYTTVTRQARSVGSNL